MVTPELSEVCIQKLEVWKKLQADFSEVGIPIEDINIWAEWDAKLTVGWEKFVKESQSC